MTAPWSAHTPEGFAPGVPRSHGDWVDWPRDTEFRRGMFVPESIGHPAKANIHMLRSLVDFYTKPGEVILDPFGGVGSIMVAALMGRNVILTEIEVRYHELQKASWKEMEAAADGIVLHYLGDCRLLLPIPCNHIITSPPYSNVLASPYSTLRAQAEKDSERADVLAGYSETSPGNLGVLNPFLYNQAMEKVYRLMVQSVLPGGTVTTIIKDFFREGHRVYLSTWATKVFTDLGMEPYHWIKRKTQGLSSNDRVSRGLEAIEDEDLMTFRKPGA